MMMMMKFIIIAITNASNVLSLFQSKETTSSKNTLADLTLLVRNDHARQKLDTRIKLTNQLFRQLPRTADFQAKYI